MTRVATAASALVAAFAGAYFAMFATPFASAADAPAAQGEQVKSIYLDEMDVSLSTSGWQSTVAKKSVGGNPLKLRGQTFARGIGTHANGIFRVDLGGNGVRFRAIAGIDDESGDKGTVEFRVEGDGSVLWTSGVLKGGGETRAIDINVKGVKTLDLVVDTTSDGYAHDHSDWVDAKIDYTGDKAPLAVAAPGNAGSNKKSNGSKKSGEYVHHWPAADQVFNKASLPDPTDRDEADAVLRRIAALIDHLKTLQGCPDLSADEARLADLKTQAGKVGMSDSAGRAKLLEQACQLRRKVAFANPLLNFDRILFIKRHFCPDAEKTGNHMCDQYFGFNAIKGGGLFVLEKPFSDHPTVKNLLENSVCQNGRFKGQKLTGEGGFLAPELSFDANEILFAWTEIADTESGRKRYQAWDEHNTYKIFRANADGTELTQLTDGPTNDFDPCYLPNGRIIFISERRGGYGRCHGRPVPSFTLHSMNYDGSDIVQLSPHETNEWQPSIDHDGMVIYTRWDYVDRGFNQAHHPWITTPDGRDARVIHGNFASDQRSRPHFEIGIRAVPNSRKLMATAACHHGQAYGSVVLIDPTVPDDDKMGPVKRLTPDQLFPEAEIATHRDPANYAAPYPLSEHFFLCVYDANSRSNAGTANNYGIYLVDAFGNKELLFRDPNISCLDPIPFRPTPLPPVISHQTLVGDPLPRGGKFTPTDSNSLPTHGLVGVANVYESTLPMPEGVKITHLRIMQLLPKTTPIAHNPAIGFGNQKSARMVLGTVPVEEDGSAYFKMPVNRPVYYQALDANGVAVQSMRSASYVHVGEKLFCRGCHEPRTRTTNYVGQSPKAWVREPSEITPEVAGSRPFSYPILVQPVLEKNCLPCHTKSRAEGKKAPDLARGDFNKNERKWYTSYISLKGYTFFWDEAGFDRVAYTTPGHFGARSSKLYQMLSKGHHDLKLSGEDMHRITLWLDCNSDFYGSYENLQDQWDGKVVWPRME